MNRRELLRRSAALGGWAGGGTGLGAMLAACGGGGDGAPNRYRQTNLVASSEAYAPQILEPGLVNAWGIAIRPAGAGGHFWVTASGESFEYVGDVDGTPLFVDDLPIVHLPAAGTTPVSGDPVGASNGVVFNQSTSNFVITQAHAEGPITAPAKFIFVSDNGVLSAWTERARSGGSGVDRPLDALSVIDYAAQGSSFFGLAITPGFDQLIVADFGANPAPDGGAHPKLRLFDGEFVEQPLNGRFTNPFIGASGFRPGDLVPFNVQALRYRNTDAVFVAYANTSADAQGNLVVAEEATGAGFGRIVEYTPAGELVRIWDDRGLLNAPWALVVAPDDFGAFSNQLIVGNFADGTMVGFDTGIRSATEYLRDDADQVLEIAGLWGLLFGNGESLGDRNAMYFAAGPDDETQGLFGSLRVA